MKVRNKLFLLILMVVGFIIFFTYFFNSLFLEDYYIKVKKQQLVKVIENIRDKKVEENFRNQDLKNIIVKEISFSDVNKNLENYPKNILDLKEKKIYFFNEIDDTQNIEQLTAFTTFNKKLLKASLSVASIKEPLSIITGYHIRIILFSAFLGMIFSWIIASFITKPLVEIDKIAQNVANFDFSKKFKKKKINDEIDNLGESINQMSLYLEENIKELNKAKLEIEDINKKLVNELKEKQQLHEMRKEFLSDVSHELKTPIAIISNYTEGLLEEVVTNKKDQKEYLKIIEDEAKSMDKLVRKLLLISRLESGIIIENRATFSLRTLILNELKPLNYISEKKNIIIRKDLEDLKFTGNKENIKIVIQNLLHNSLKYSPLDSYIDITLKDKRFSISNSSNINEESFKKIGNPFYRDDKVRKREEGTGLGLTIVKKILDSHKITYKIEKVKDKVIFSFKY